MSPEVAIASHACAHIGAVQVPVFSGFAAPAVAQRLQDSEARVAITTTVSSRRGREVPMLAILEEARRDAPALEHVVVAPWDELTADCPGLTEALAVDSEHPYLLTYTSGTTGKPKGVVHVHGGFLVSIAREACYQADARPGDVIHFATDMGWIMGPWTVVGGGAMGARIVFAEGAPDWPHDRLWRLIEQERVSILGCSPTLIRALVPHGDPQADLSSLRLVLTTGEPWNPDPYMWLHERVGGGRCPIINASGGTEIGACFLSPSVAMPIKACSLGFAALGMAMDVVDDDGVSLAGTGEVGELVCRQPFPGMTRGFWRDRERFLDTYWRRFPGIWTHGDWASVDADGYWFLHGRSDDTLNIAGKRIGPAEIESAVVAHPAVAEAAAVGIPHEVKGEVAWVFCVLVPGTPGSDDLADELRALVAGDLGKAFAPERVVFVSGLPKTRSAKIVRRAVRATALGRDPGDVSSVENPEVLDEIAAHA
jgi:acetyl-CoA synthetase